MSANAKGVFAHLDCLINAIAELEKAGFHDLMVNAPMPRHEIEEAIYKGKPSPVRWWTLTGGLIGSTGGFTLASLASVTWPMALPGGKPAVSVPPFIVITFECTVLLGALFTLLGLLYHCRLPAMNLDIELCDPRYSDDHFGICVKGLGSEQRQQAAKIMHDQGAVEVVSNTEEA